MAQEGIDISNMLNDVNTVLHTHLNNILNPILTEKKNIQQILLNMPYVQHLNNENVKLKNECVTLRSELNAQRTFYEATNNQKDSIIQELSTKLDQLGKGTVKLEVKELNSDNNNDKTPISSLLEKNSSSVKNHKVNLTSSKNFFSTLYEDDEDDDEDEEESEDEDEEESEDEDEEESEEEESEDEDEDEEESEQEEEDTVDNKEIGTKLEKEQNNEECCMGRGECFRQIEAGGSGYSYNTGCGKCSLKECTDCKVKIPEIILDCHKGNCQNCAVKRHSKKADTDKLLEGLTEEGAESINQGCDEGPSGDEGPTSLNKSEEEDEEQEEVDEEEEQEEVDEDDEEDEEEYEEEDEEEDEEDEEDEEEDMEVEEITIDGEVYLTENQHNGNIYKCDSEGEIVEDKNGDWVKVGYYKNGISFFI